MRDSLAGPLLVLVASLLWGTDSLFRFPTAARLDPTFIVFCEHWIGLLILVPWVWLKERPRLFKLGIKGWMAAFIVGAGGGAIATVLMTASFRYINPSVTILLQKLQPVIVVLLAYLFLGERPKPKFYPWAVVAIVAGLVLSFPDLDVGVLLQHGSLRAKGLIYAISACILWGISTAAGRTLLLRTTAGVATFWRYVFGALTLIVILQAAQVHVDVGSVLSSREILIALAYLSVVSGVIPMFIYYAGMARAQASIVTFVELTYPVSAVVLNTIFLRTPLTHVQMGAGAALLVAVTAISV